MPDKPTPRKKPAAKEKVPLPTAKAAEDEEMDDPLEAMTVLELAAYVQANPFAHLTHANIRRLFVIGERFWRSMLVLRPPAMGRKINPQLFQRWLWMNRSAIEKLSNPEGGK